MVVKAYFESIKKEIIDTLKKAKGEIRVAVAWITDEDIIRTLTNLAKEGRQVELIISNSKENFINRNNLKKFIQAGGKLFISESKFLHHKFSIIDEFYLINGSYNWTYYATKNEENVLIFDFSESAEEKPKLIRQFQIRFQTIKTKFSKEIDLVSLNMIAVDNITVQKSLNEIDREEILLRAEFEEEVKHSIEKSRERGIPISSEFMLSRMLSDGGGVEFVSRIIRDEKSSKTMKSGFDKLASAEPSAVDLSFEYLVCKSKYGTLFSEDDKTFCRKVMKQYEMELPA